MTCAAKLGLALSQSLLTTFSKQHPNKKFPNNCAQRTGFGLTSCTHQSLKLSPTTAAPHMKGFFLSFFQPQKGFKASGI